MENNNNKNLTTLFSKKLFNKNKLLFIFVLSIFLLFTVFYFLKNKQEQFLSLIIKNTEISGLSVKESGFLKMMS